MNNKVLATPGQITFLVQTLRANSIVNNIFEISFDNFCDIDLSEAYYKRMLALTYNKKYNELFEILNRHCKSKI